MSHEPFFLPLYGLKLIRETVGTEETVKTRALIKRTILFILFLKFISAQFKGFFSTVWTMKMKISLYRKNCEKL